MFNNPNGVRTSQVICINSGDCIIQCCSLSLKNKKIKVSDIITDATTDSSLNTVLSKKVDTGTFNSFASSVSSQLNSFSGALSTFGGQIALKQDKITPTAELDLTLIDTADIESLRSIVKALATELNTLGLIRLKSAEETA